MTPATAPAGSAWRAAALWTAEPLPEERLTLRYAEVMTALVQACRADENHLAATHAAHKLVQLDPLDEAAHRELMLAYARSGRRARALRQYLECRTLIY